MVSENEPKRDDESKRAFRNLAAKITRKLDQDLGEVRTIYDRLAELERRQLKEWVNLLADLEEPRKVSAYFSAKIQLLIQDGEYAREVLVRVCALKRAIEAWDQGEEFLPGSPQDL